VGGGQVGAEERLWLRLTGGVADQNPADRDRRDAGMVPDGGARGSQQFVLLGGIPL
jgi:hypothetical protein